MAFGFGVLRHSPQIFWSMTPRELASAVEGAFGRRRQAMTRGALDALVRAFPD
jgi:uncharacterized phage protein (TIGR02216 family)